MVGTPDDDEIAIDLHLGQRGGVVGPVGAPPQTDEEDVLARRGVTPRACDGVAGGYPVEHRGPSTASELSLGTAETRLQVTCVHNGPPY